MRESKTLTRDIEATAIPYGDRISLSAGATIYVTQALGGSYTGMTDRGYMVRIEGKDADAIGEEVTPAPASVAESVRATDVVPVQAAPAATVIVPVGSFWSRTMVSVALDDPLPTSSRNCAKTVLVPSPLERVHDLDVA